MNEMPVNPVPPALEEPKKNNTWIWITAAVVILCCCCVGALGLWWLWTNGDEIFGTGMNLLAQFA